MDRRPLARPHRGHARVHETDARPIDESSLTFERVPRPGLSVRLRDRAGIFLNSPLRTFHCESIGNQLPIEGGAISRCTIWLLSDLSIEAISTNYASRRVMAISQQLPYRKGLAPLFSRACASTNVTSATRQTALL